jgi:hypothetical protein
VLKDALADFMKCARPLGVLQDVRLNTAQIHGERAQAFLRDAGSVRQHDERLPKRRPNMRPATPLLFALSLSVLALVHRA